MKESVLIVVVILNAAVLNLFFEADGFGVALLASVVASVVLFPVSAVEYLLINHLFGLAKKLGKLR